MARVEIQFGGFGGQGIILAGLILGRALSLYDNKEAVFTQSYGPEARGGAASSGVVMDDEGVDYPYVESPDIFIVMSSHAYSTYIDRVKPGATIIYDCDLVSLDDRVPDGAKLYPINATKLAERLGNRIVANIIMLGYFTRITGIVSYDSMVRSVSEMVPPKAKELNLRAFDVGYNYEREAGGEA